MASMIFAIFSASGLVGGVEFYNHSLVSYLPPRTAEHALTVEYFPWESETEWQSESQNLEPGFNPLINIALTLSHSPSQRVYTKR